MRFVYWAALAVGPILVVYAGLFGAMVTTIRTTAGGPVEREPSGLIGFGCGSAAESGFAFEATLVLRAVVGLVLIAAYLSHRREARRA